MTPDQRETILRHVGNGAKFGEAAAMAGVKFSDLAAEWQAGSAERDEVAAEFVADCRAARARYLATTRATAEAAAGSRESPDLLAVVREVEADAEPATVDTGARATSPDLLAVDLLNGDSLTSDERARLRSEHEAFVRDGLTLFETILAVQDRRRLRRGTAPSDRRARLLPSTV